MVKVLTLSASLTLFAVIAFFPRHLLSVVVWVSPVVPTLMALCLARVAVAVPLPVFAFDGVEDNVPTVFHAGVVAGVLPKGSSCE